MAQILAGHAANALAQPLPHLLAEGHGSRLGRHGGSLGIDLGVNVVAAAEPGSGHGHAALQGSAHHAGIVAVGQRPGGGVHQHQRDSGALVDSLQCRDNRVGVQNIDAPADVLLQLILVHAEDMGMGAQLLMHIVAEGNSAGGMPNR